MKKTIFLAVALSLLLCATVFAAGTSDTKVHGQKVAVDWDFHTYSIANPEQARNSRMFIRNLDPDKSIYVWRVILIAPDGSDVCFYEESDVEHFCYFVGDLVADEAKFPKRAPFLLAPYESTSFSVPISNFTDPTKFANWPEEGRPFFVIWWYSEGGRDLVTPAEIWTIHRNVVDGIRVSLDRWEGIVVENYSAGGR